MSDSLRCIVWRNFPGKGAKLSVLMAIAEVCNSFGSGHRHIAELAEISRLSPSTVFISIKALRKDRWIFTDRMTGQGGTLIFQINVPKLSRSTRTDHHLNLPAINAIRAAQTVRSKQNDRAVRIHADSAALTLGSASLIAASMRASKSDEQIP